MAKTDLDSEMTLSVTRPSGTFTKLQVREWTTTVSAGPDKGKTATTLGALLRVGTDPTNDIVLSDGTVSRRHVEIERTPLGFLVRDLGSRNGTFLDDRRVVQAYLVAGDKIVLGKTKLVVTQEDKPTDVALALGETCGDLFGESDAMRALFAQLRRAAMNDAHVLLEGETGTGKDLAARALHTLSSHRSGTFRVVDCSRISADNADAELFSADGAFASADGGTLYLDEVSELPAKVQARLNRVLESREIPASAGHKARPFSGRVVASTQRNLEEDVAQDRFRRDLYFRLAMERVALPALRTHKGDLRPLCVHLLKRLGLKVQLSQETLSLFEGYDWPGNVRELRNTLERGALTQETGGASWLNFQALNASKKNASPKSIGTMFSSLPYHEAKDRVVFDFEKEYFAEVMRQVNFDIQLAERKTGLSMQSLYRLLKKNGLRLKQLKNAQGLED